MLKDVQWGPVFMDCLAIFVTVYALLQASSLIVFIIAGIVLGSELLQVVAHLRGFRYSLKTPDRILVKRLARSKKKFLTD